MLQKGNPSQWDEEKVIKIACKWQHNRWKRQLSVRQSEDRCAKLVLLSLWCRVNLTEGYLTAAAEAENWRGRCDSQSSSCIEFIRCWETHCWTTCSCIYFSCCSTTFLQTACFPWRKLLQQDAEILWRILIRKEKCGPNTDHAGFWYLYALMKLCVSSH